VIYEKRVHRQNSRREKLQVRERLKRERAAAARALRGSGGNDVAGTKDEATEDSIATEALISRGTSMFENRSQDC
jgi:hypothetical protein